ncbi:MAG: N-acetylglucosamine-6-phosphate deacetylase, partial [Lentisphaeria bacterium]|nr:N-acetylglucosamine-6-phosphate deacetylase [Lentisphaeria bacterium]
MATLLLKNCHLISPDVDLPNAAVLIEGEKVKRIFAPGDALPAADSVMDMEGDMVMPGFVDVHCHGRSGEDFCDATDNAITTMAVDKLKE